MGVVDKLIESIGMTLFGMTLFCIADLASGPVTVKARLADLDQNFHVGRYQASIPHYDLAAVFPH